MSNSRTAEQTDDNRKRISYTVRYTQPASLRATARSLLVAPDHLEKQLPFLSARPIFADRALRVGVLGQTDH
jgi:hypothetical protein